jgi:glutathione-regulated potassium-efflux system ancillary protein KefG
MPSDVLILFAHPAPHRSRVNRALRRAVIDLPGVTFHDLYAAYPDFMIDVADEQALLLAHDVIVLQHPFYWYSAPAIVKEWQDLVLQHGFAYGVDGRALAGKTLMSAISTGGHEASYNDAGMNRFAVEELLRPFEQTARLCGMNWLPPFVIHGTHAIEDEAVGQAAEAYRRLIGELRHGRDAVAAGSNGAGNGRTRANEPTS